MDRLLVLMALLLLVLLGIEASVLGRSPVLVTKVLSRRLEFLAVLVVVVSLVPAQVRLDLESRRRHWLVGELARSQGRS